MRFGFEGQRDGINEQNIYTAVTGSGTISIRVGRY